MLSTSDGNRGLWPASGYSLMMAQSQMSNNVISNINATVSAQCSLLTRKKMKTSWYTQSQALYLPIA